MPCYLGKRLSLPTFLLHLVLPLTGRFFVKPLGKALARVGAGVEWMWGRGLYGRPLLEEARPVTHLPHPAPTRAYLIHGAMGIGV